MSQSKHWDQCMPTSLQYSTGEELLPCTGQHTPFFITPGTMVSYSCPTSQVIANMYHLAGVDTQV